MRVNPISEIVIGWESPQASVCWSTRFVYKMFCISLDLSYISYKHYSENKRSNNLNPTKNEMYTGAAEGKSVHAPQEAPSFTLV